MLKWRLQTRDESQVPLTINCWPSVSGADSYVNIEYEATAPFDLHKVGPDSNSLARRAAHLHGLGRVPAGPVGVGGRKGQLLWW